MKKKDYWEIDIGGRKGKIYRIHYRYEKGDNYKMYEYKIVNERTRDTMIVQDTMNFPVGAMYMTPFDDFKDIWVIRNKRRVK